MEGDFSMKEFIKKRLGTMSGSILFYGIAAAMQVLFAFVLRDIINAAVETEINQLYTGVIYAIVIILSSIFIEAIAIVLKNNFIFKVVQDIKNNLAARIMSKNVKSYGKKSNSYYINMMTQDMDMISKDYLSQIVSLAYDVLGLVFSLVAIIYISWKLTLSIALLLLIPMLVPALLGGILNKYRKKLSQSNEEYISVLKQIFEGFEVVKTFNVRERILELHKKRNGVKEEAYFKHKSAESSMHTLSNNLGFLVHIGALSVGSYLVIRGEITIGALIAAVQIMNGIVQPINYISQRMTTMKSTENVRDKIFSELTAEEATTEGSSVALPGNSIELKNLSYAYNEENVLEDINFKFTTGKKYAIIGASGSGKTTLFRLLLGYYTDYNGEILFDDMDLKNVNPDSIYDVLSTIHQNVFLFDDNFVNNITLYNNYPTEEIERAINQANLATLYNKVNNEGITSLGEYGSILSGGEKQRIAIARSLIKNSKIILVDEATASLDPQNTKDIYDVLLSLEDVMIIAITHDWDEELLTRFDEVYQLDKGKLTSVQLQKKVG